MEWRKSKVLELCIKIRNVKNRKYSLTIEKRRDNNKWNLLLQEFVRLNFDGFEDSDRKVAVGFCIRDNYGVIKSTRIIRYRNNFILMARGTRFEGRY